MRTSLNVSFGVGDPGISTAADISGDRPTTESEREWSGPREWSLDTDESLLPLDNNVVSLTAIDAPRADTDLLDVDFFTVEEEEDAAPFAFGGSGLFGGGSGDGSFLSPASGFGGFGSGGFTPLAPGAGPQEVAAGREPLSIVDPSSTEIAHLASVDVKSSGAHLGGGIYFSANHKPSPGGASTAIAQRSLGGESEAHRTIEFDFTLPGDPTTWDDYRNGSTIRTGYDASLHVGDRLSDGEFYSGPAASLLIAADANDLSGQVTLTGYPSASNSLNGQGGVLHQSGGILSAGGYTAESVNGDEGGYFSVRGAEAVGGMSGGGAFLSTDIDGDGAAETYLIGATSRVLQLAGPAGNTYSEAQVTAFSPHYADLADTILSLSGSAARTADDFGRITLLSGQSAGSNKTTVTGQFFHEDIFGGVNADRLSGNGGDDALFGRGGADILTGGNGADRFVFAENGGRDRITDFSGAEGDVIDLSAIDADISVGAGGNQAFDFVGGEGFSGEAGELRAIGLGSNNLRVEGDTNGDGVADFVLTLNGSPEISAGDFVL